MNIFCFVAKRSRSSFSLARFRNPLQQARYLIMGSDQILTNTFGHSTYQYGPSKIVNKSAEKAMNLIDKSLQLSGIIIHLETPQIFFDPDFLTLNHRYNNSAVQITKKVYILYKNKICQIESRN